jgi:hypothetical protein
MTEGARRLRTAAARLRSHQTTRLLAGAALRGLGLGLGVVAALLLAERFVALPAVVRAAGLIAAAGLPLAVLGHALLLRLPALRNAEEAARRTEAQAAVLRERLVPALQVLDTRDDFRTGYSTELVDAFVDDTATIVERVLPSSLPYNAGFRTGALTAAVAVALAVLAVGVTLPSGLGRGLARLAGAFGELGPRPRSSSIRATSRFRAASRSRSRRAWITCTCRTAPRARRSSGAPTTTRPGRTWTSRAS